MSMAFIAVIVMVIVVILASNSLSNDSNKQDNPDVKTQTVENPNYNPYDPTSEKVIEKSTTTSGNNISEESKILDAIKGLFMEKT